MSKEGRRYWTDESFITKFTNGKAIVRNVRVSQNFGECLHVPDTNYILVKVIPPFNENRKSQIYLYQQYYLNLFLFLCYFPLDYVEDIFQTFLTSTKDELKGASDKLKDITPSPMNTMLEKESKSTAVQKKMERSKKNTENVPPYNTRYQQPHYHDIYFGLAYQIHISCACNVYHRYAILYN